MTHTVVLGAGYAGMVAAQLVARQPGQRTTLVNAAEEFVERVRLHQVAAGQEVPRRRLRDMLAGSSVALRVAEVVGLDPDRRVVRLSSGDDLSYDALIYALGSTASDAPVPGVAEYAHSVSTLAGAGALRTRLTGGGSVAVVGGGLTGVEAAAEFAETRPDLTVRVLTDGPLGVDLSARGRRHVRRVFDRLGVEVHEHAQVREVHASGVELLDGSRVDADIVVWTAGFAVSPLAARAGLAVDGWGRVRVDEALRSVSHPEVYAIGDAAALHSADGRELRMACATGLPSARHVARALGEHNAGREPGPLRFRYVNQCISLGRRDALVQFVRADDSPVERVLTGRFAAWYKEMIVRGAFAVQARPGWVRLTPGGGRAPRSAAVRPQRT